MSDQEILEKLQEILDKQKEIQNQQMLLIERQNVLEAEIKKIIRKMNYNDFKKKF